MAERSRKMASTWSKVPRKELESKLNLAMQMLVKIAGNKETWTLSEARRVIKQIADVEEDTPK